MNDTRTQGKQARIANGHCLARTIPPRILQSLVSRHKQSVPAPNQNHHNEGVAPPTQPDEGCRGPTTPGCGSIPSCERQRLLQSTLTLACPINQVNSLAKQENTISTAPKPAEKTKMPSEHPSSAVSVQNNVGRITASATFCIGRHSLNLSRPWVQCHP